MLQHSVVGLREDNCAKVDEAGFGHVMFVRLRLLPAEARFIERDQWHGQDGLRRVGSFLLLLLEFLVLLLMLFDGFNFLLARPRLLYGIIVVAATHELSEPQHVNALMHSGFTVVQREADFVGVRKVAANLLINLEPRRVQCFIRHEALP